MFTTIVVALDGSEYSDRALDLAMDITRKYAAKLHLIHVNSVQEIFISFGGASALIKPEDYEKPGQEILALASQKATSCGCVVDTHQLDGDHARAVLDKVEALSADLIVVGSKGHSDLSGILLGSVSHKITHLAPCPCLIAR